MQTQTLVGEQGPASSAGLLQSRSGPLGDTIVSELHGKYYEETRNNRVFWTTMSAGVIFPAPAATAANVMTLANPVGSGRNLALISFDMVFTIIPVTPVTGLYGLFLNTNPLAAAVTGTAMTVIPAKVGATASNVAVPLSTSTLPAAATLWLPFAQKVTGEVVTAFPLPALPAFHIDFDGRALLTPGTSVTPEMTAADATNGSVICSFCWEEVPV